MIVIYFHIWTNADWVNITNNIFNKIIESKLIEKVQYIKVCILSKYSLNKLKKICDHLNHDKVIIEHNNNKKLYERFTLNTILKDVLKYKDNYKILYLHAKGVTKNKYTKYQELCIQDWVTYLTYFNVTRHEEVIKMLDVYATCGCDYHNKIRDGRRYAGNFWWANSDHIKKLQFLKYTNEYYPDLFKNPRQLRKYIRESETWLLSCNEYNNDTYTLHSSNVDHYHNRFTLNVDSY